MKEGIAMPTEKVPAPAITSVAELQGASEVTWAEENMRVMCEERICRMMKNMRPMNGIHCSPYTSSHNYIMFSHL